MDKNKFDTFLRDKLVTALTAAPALAVMVISAIYQSLASTTPGISRDLPFAMGCVTLLTVAASLILAVMYGKIFTTNIFAVLFGLGFVSYLAVVINGTTDIASDDFFQLITLVLTIPLWSYMPVAEKMSDTSYIPALIIAAAITLLCIGGSVYITFKNKRRIVLDGKIKLDRPVVVEGKYDKIKLSSVIDSEIIVTDGFGIFKEEEKTNMLRAIAEKRGLIVLTDSDGGGLVIRNHLRSVIPSDKLTHLYIPEIQGKEKRKKAPSKEGYLGVEGMERELLIKLFEPFTVKKKPKNKRQITSVDLFDDGLKGGKGSSEKRKALCQKAGLPQNISSTALLEAMNLLYTYDEYKEILLEIEGSENGKRE